RRRLRVRGAMSRSSSASPREARTPGNGNSARSRPSATPPLSSLVRRGPGHTGAGERLVNLIKPGQPRLGDGGHDTSETRRPRGGPGGRSPETVRLLRRGLGARPGDRTGAGHLDVGVVAEDPALPDLELERGVALLVELHGAVPGDGRRPDQPPAIRL